jgi:3-oxoacyl-[acyl-carrier protein] reductase
MGALGKTLVQTFVSAGFNVALPVRGETPGTNMSGIAFSDKCDLTDEEQTKKFFFNVRENIGDVDILINAAGGYLGGKTIEEGGVADIEKMFRLNFLTAYLASSQVLRSMKERKFGRIINIAAKAGLYPSAGRGAYAVSKRAVITLTQVIAEETRGTGVTCNAIAPFILRTKENEDSMPGSDQSLWVTPQEIASIVMYLSSAEAGFINGAVIPA